MAEIREEDLMVVCVEAAKTIAATFNSEANDALQRISRAMFNSRMDGSQVVVTPVEDNVVNQDVVARATATTIGLVLDALNGRSDGYE